MNEHFLKKLEEETLKIIKEIKICPNINQRILSNKLGISLGKTNYLLKALIKKGLIKVKNFTNNPGKFRKIKYVLTKEGLEHRVYLTYHFLRRKEMEYNHIKNDWEQLITSKNGKIY